MSWKKRALAAALAGLCLLSGCSLPGRQQDEGPKDTVDVSDAYFGLAWYKNGTLNPVTDTDSINAMLREELFYRERIAQDSALVEQLRHDDYLEEYARENYHMQRRDEHVYIVEE